jgi:CXXX repeat peptide maturase
MTKSDDNQQLMRLDHAPICRHCDAYQCKRCVWMNQKLTLDLNTPSHQQCVVAHVERNASRHLQKLLNEKDIRLSNNQEIKEINYLDPFNNYKQWK